MNNIQKRTGIAVAGLLVLLSSFCMFYPPPNDHIYSESINSSPAEFKVPLSFSPADPFYLGDVKLPEAGIRVISGFAFTDSSKITFAVYVITATLLLLAHSIVLSENIYLLTAFSKAP